MSFFDKIYDIAHADLFKYVFGVWGYSANMDLIEKQSG